jgi:type VI protein secretion system component VasK
MSSNEQERVRKIARRIAEQIAGERGDATGDGAQTANSNSNEVSALQAELTKLNRRLAQLEAQVGGDGGDNIQREAATASKDGSSAKSAAHATHVHAPHLMGGGGTYVSAVHPSEQRFGINEAVAELVDYFEAGKTCEMEPGGKPCDHCGMCSARGF